MNYMPGSKCMSIINEFKKLKGFNEIKINVLSAYMKEELALRFGEYQIENFFSKPLKTSNIHKLLNSIDI